jgi:hypothetical protein
VGVFTRTPLIPYPACAGGFNFSTDGALVDGCLAVFPRLQGRTNVSLFFLSELFGIGSVIPDPYAVDIFCHFCFGFTNI